MNIIKNQPQKMLLDLQKLNELNSMGYAGKFCLGDTVVAACGDWTGGAKYILEHEAVYDKMTNTYWERRCYEGRGNLSR
ncbi:MAG: hypothetical protein JRI61_04085 [Deltaproteobacteria bacterium]|nr:hypothetical protein [Deltaproteobacteria bacterium]